MLRFRLCKVENIAFNLNCRSYCWQIKPFPVECICNLCSKTWSAYMDYLTSHDLCLTTPIHFTVLRRLAIKTDGIGSRKSGFRFAPRFATLAGGGEGGRENAIWIGSIGELRSGFTSMLSWPIQAIIAWRWGWLARKSPSWLRVNTVVPVTWCSWRSRVTVYQMHFDEAVHLWMSGCLVFLFFRLIVYATYSFPYLP